MNGILAVYHESGDGRTFLLGVSEDPLLLRHTARELLKDSPPPGDALDRARLDALREMAEVPA